MPPAEGVAISSLQSVDRRGNQVGVLSAPFSLGSTGGRGRGGARAIEDGGTQSYVGYVNGKGRIVLWYVCSCFGREGSWPRDHGGLGMRQCVVLFCACGFFVGIKLSRKCRMSPSLVRVRVTGLGCPVWWDLSVDESFRTVRELVGTRTGMELGCIGLETEGRLVEDKLLVGRYPSTGM